MIFLPGGGNGTKNLLAHEGLKKVILDYYDRDKYIAAICAAPSILGHYGLLKGKKATCFPGFESELIGADYRGDGVVVDGKIITARGMGKTIDLGLKLLEILDGNETAVTQSNIWYNILIAFVHNNTTTENNCCIDYYILRR